MMRSTSLELNPSSNSRAISRRNCSSVVIETYVSSLCSESSQSRLNLLCQRPEIRHPLQFVIRQLDSEVMLEPRQQIECLQTVDSERLKKVVVGRELFPRHFKMQSRKIQDLFECVIRSRR